MFNNNVADQFKVRAVVGNLYHFANGNLPSLLLNNPLGIQRIIHGVVLYPPDPPNILNFRGPSTGSSYRNPIGHLNKFGFRTPPLGQTGRVPFRKSGKLGSVRPISKLPFSTR
jgi:hypothetical protein